MSMIAFGTGLALWTFLEYALHRWVFHAFAFGKAAAHEHLEHHAQVDYFAPWTAKLQMAVVVLGLLSAITVPVLGFGSGAALAAGVVAGWLTYEALHRAIHVFPPRGVYAAWAWRHHLHHHFVNPRANHGVSSPIWDLVFRTYAPVETVSVPPRQAHKLPWLLVGDTIRPDLASTYTLGRSRRSAPAAAPDRAGCGVGDPTPVEEGRVPHAGSDPRVAVTIPTPGG